jgi:hypothetical protein
MSLPIGTIIRFASFSIFARRALARARLGCGAITSLAGLALGCASDGVDLGGGVLNQTLERGARCQDSTIVFGGVRVTNQQDLEDLEGCEEIRGDLTIQLFAEAKLTPLHALQIVDGGFLLGESLINSLSDEQRGDSELVDETVRVERALRGTWLASLEGVESLERVGALALMDTAVRDLLPLAQLSGIGGASVSPEGVFQSNELVIQGNPLLRDLTGLERVRGVTELQIGFNGALESLAGLTLGPDLTLLSVFEELALTDIDAVSAVTTLGALELNTVGVTHLDALSGVLSVQGAISIANNPDLIDVRGLGNVSQARSFELVNNAKLELLPSFQSYFAPPDIIVITDNPELEELTFDFFNSSTDGFLVGDELLSLSTGGMAITNNATLRRVAFPAARNESLGVSSMQVVAFERNPSLSEIDFGGLSRADRLAILQNPALGEVNLGKLARVDTLQITDNPALDTNVFDPVLTFERIESGNAPIATP